MAGPEDLEGDVDATLEELEPLGGTTPSEAPEDDRLGSLDRMLERLDLLDDLDSLHGGGIGGLATGVELFGEHLAHGPYDSLLEAFEPVRDIADHTDVFDDLF